MLSCLSTSYSIGRYYIPDFVPFIFTTTPNPPAVIFQNANNQAPVFITSNSTDNKILVNNFNQLNFKENRTIYINCKLTDSSNTASAYVLGFRGSDSGGENSIIIYRNIISGSPTFARIGVRTRVANLITAKTKDFLITDLTSKTLQFFIIITKVSSTKTILVIRSYDPNILSDLIIGIDREIDISAFYTLFPNIDNFNMNQNVAVPNLTMSCNYNIAGYYNRALTESECLAIATANA